MIFQSIIDHGDQKKTFKILKTLEPEYNRLVFFDGLKFFHGANFPDDRYFGEEFRTNQVFFFLDP